jgi:hypothetical protein
VLVEVRLAQLPRRAAAHLAGHTPARRRDEAAAAALAEPDGAALAAPLSLRVSGPLPPSARRLWLGFA